MRRGLGTFAATLFLALTFAASALGAYTPRLWVHQFPRTGGGGATTIRFTTDRTDEATAKVTIYSDAGYAVAMSQAPGTRIGTVRTVLQMRAVSPDVLVPVEGAIQADSPANWATQAVQCTGTASHANVWVLVLSASGRQLQVPMFVDRSPQAPPDPPPTTSKIQVCLPPPDVPESAGGAAFGAKVVEAALTFDAGVVTTLARRRNHMWLAYATPWTSFRPPANASGTVGARALVPLPQSLSLNARYLKKRRAAMLGGRLVIGTSQQTPEEFEAVFRSSRLAVFAGTRPNRLARTGSTRALTSRGTFRLTRRIRRTTYFRVSFSRVEAIDGTVCVGLNGPPTPAGCTATWSLFARSRVVRVRVVR